MKKFGLFLLDASALYGALALTLFIRYGDKFSEQYGIHLLPFSVIFLIWILIFYITNLYDLGLLRNNLKFYSNLYWANIFASGISIIFFYLIPLFVITPKTNLFIFILIFSAIETIFRSLVNRFNEKGSKKSLLIVGINQQSLELAKFIKNNPQLGYEIKYLMEINGNDNKYSDNISVIRGIENLNKIIGNDEINTVIVSPEAYQHSSIIDIFYRSLDSRINFRNLSSFYENITSRVPLGAINQIWFLENLSEGSKKAYETGKRVLDIIFSILIAIFSMPFFPLIILAIKLDSRGPVFYHQKRLGQAGRIFEITKFRTMMDNAERDTGAVWASENDPRITKIGKFLRKSRIDEIPQFWNVLKGEMSFVGPRAERPEFYEKLKENVPFYEERYLIKPGLSGWAQINYGYGSSVADAAEKLQYDLYYIKNRSLLLDIGIILKTINIALRQSGR